MMSFDEQLIRSEDRERRRRLIGHDGRGWRGRSIERRSPRVPHGAPYRLGGSGSA